MITDEIKKYQEEIISAIDNFDLYADLIVDENRIEIPLNIDTLEFSKKQYEAWEETVLNYDKDYDKFNVHLMNDGSGYEYWTVKQEETNYCYVIVEIEEINDKNVQNIIEAIQAAFDYYNEKIEKIKGMNESLAASLNKLISEALDGTDSGTEDDEEDYLDITEDVTTLCDKIDKADAELKEIVKTLTEDNKKDIVFKNEWSIIDDPYSSELQCLSDDEFKLILFYLVSKNCYRARLTSLNNEKFPLFDSRRVEFDSGDYKTWEETLAQLQKFANESFNINLIIKNKPNKDIIDKLVKTVTDKYHQSVKADFDKIPKNTKNQMVIEFSIENPKWYEKTKLYFELLIIKEQDSTYSWKETYNSNEGHKFKTAVEAYEDAVEFNEYPLKDLEDFEIDKTANDVAKYFNENINEDLLDDVNNIEKFYALDLNDPESLDNIWTLREFTDNMDSKDGKTLCKYTKIGLIDTINSEIEDINDSHYDPVTGEETTEETIDRDITNKDLFGYLEYLPTGAELVSIENYDINKLYDEPNQPKE